MKLSNKGKEFIHQFEGCKLTAYKCPAGVWTIGMGNTYYEDGSKVKQGDTITLQRAYELFNLIIGKYEKLVESHLKLPVLQHQFDALVSHAYNCGYSETLYKMVNSKDNQLYNWWISHYIQGGGKVLPGLVKRRKAEASLFVTGHA